MISKYLSIAAALGLYFVLEPSWSTLCRGALLEFVDAFWSATLTEGGDIQIGQVHISWSEACSGLNALAVMMGLAVWSGLSLSPTAFWRRLVAAIGIAFGINLARSLSIAAARVALAPAWEGETVHFFFGFIWIAAGVFAFARITRDDLNSDIVLWVHVACVLAVIAMVASWPGGSLAAACGLTCLFVTASARRVPPSRIAILGWLLSGIAIAWSQMESLWLPWLLASPYCGGHALRRSFPAAVVWIGTIPVLSMQPVAWWVGSPALALTAYTVFRTARGETWDPVPFRWTPLVATAGIPFLLPHLIAPSAETILPSPALMPRSLSPSAYLVRAPGQAADLAVLWYGSDSRGRHHSIQSCLALRRAAFQRIGSVLRRGDVWMTEFFLFDGELHSSYASYLLATAAPWSAPGVHLVIESPIESMDSAFFAEEAARTAEIIRMASSQVPAVAPTVTSRDAAAPAKDSNLANRSMRSIRIAGRP
jgi:exosortase/archaeosortase family protein